MFLQQEAGGDWSADPGATEPLYSGTDTRVTVARRGARVEVQRLVTRGQYWSLCSVECHEATVPAGTVTTQFYTVRGAASHVLVNQSLTLLRRGSQDGSLRPAPGLVQLPGLRYEAPDRGLGWDGARDLRSPEPLLSLAISPPEDQAALQSSMVKLVRAAVESQGLSAVNGVSDFMCKMKEANKF